jgi:hypothetical protein
VLNKPKMHQNYLANDSCIKLTGSDKKKQTSEMHISISTNQRKTLGESATDLISNFWNSL